MVCVETFYLAVRTLRIQQGAPQAGLLSKQARGRLQRVSEQHRTYTSQACVYTMPFPRGSKYPLFKVSDQKTSVAMIFGTRYLK